MATQRVTKSPQLSLRASSLGTQTSQMPLYSESRTAPTRRSCRAPTSFCRPASAVMRPRQARLSSGRLSVPRCISVSAVACAL
jgi:hypothetical protein